ncbi:hypothetical protein B0A48_05015 [Cryoendolithus antarcticus]|uniref:Beta-catenin-like protein 1 N-terminal domain-containing protein n=1 Tax=Cryoendolithus antarcticus TaxID=1507870 RepID=A0A1V8TE16_9PEZI|nr:hypothetical protein B0A48_05015 [Cryoendolithus antarcticus]
MASITDLFKGPSQASSSGSIKRKFNSHDADRAYKATKYSSNSSPKQASLEDAPEDDDFEAGPSLPPAEDLPDDEEGRFFGGGVSRDAAEALNYIDTQDTNDANGIEYGVEKIDASWLKRTAVSFERRIAKNAELRAKHEGEPAKFMASEAELDAQVKEWSLLSEHGELYPPFVESGAAGQLVGLLGHENTDVAIGAVQILSELLDEDVEVDEEAWEGLVEALLEADLGELVMSNLGRLNEQEESDREGVYHCLAVLGALAGKQEVAERVGTVQVLEWLCDRIRRAEKSVGQNKQMAAEVLQVLLQSSSELRQKLAGDVEGVDLFLQLLALYRKRDPVKDSLEEEWVENIFDALTCVLDETPGKAAYLEAEGMELTLIMLKEGGFSKSRALRVLDHALGGVEGAAGVCEKLVEAGGLKTLFSTFTKKPSGTTTEHLLGIFTALLRWLPGESAARIRTLNKFTEKNCEKVAKIVELRKDFARRLSAADEEIKLERRMMDEEDWPEREAEWLSRRLEGGLFGLQTTDVILAWLVAEDKTAKKVIIDGLGGLADVKASLVEQAAGAEDDEAKEMLSTLIDFL